MHHNRPMRWLACLAIVLMSVCGVAFAQGGASDSAKEQAQRQQSQPGNNAPFWRDVRGGGNQYQTTQVRGVESAVLVQTEGETWRQARNVITYYGGWVLVIVVVAIALFYFIRGAIKMHGPPTGRKLERFNVWHRTVHWTVAITFCVLALSGIILLFGKYVLLPVFGYKLFAWLAILSKNAHNFVGPVFAVATLLMIVTYLKDNLPKAYDFNWFAKAGGLLTGTHVPSGRYNAGEKSWFWIGVCVLGIVVSVTGFILDFPNFAQGRAAMQQAHVIHVIAAVIFVALSLGHIYMGTLGVQGAYESMRRGMVDETWAKEHHEYWYNDTKARQGHAPGGAPSAAVASAMKEGWK